MSEHERVDSFLRQLATVRRLSDNTVAAYRRDLESLLEFMDKEGVNAVADLDATQLKIGNGFDGTTDINLSWTDPVDPDLVTIEVYRKGYGFYPEYDDGGGFVPAAPADIATALGAGWTFVASVPAGTGAYADEPGTRDFWYYVVFANDGCNDGGVSNRTGGTLQKRMKSVAGEVYAKTGYMRGIRTLSGYVRALDGRWYAFSVLFNGFKGSSAPYNRIHDQVCRILARSTGDSPP